MLAIVLAAATMLELEAAGGAAFPVDPVQGEGPRSLALQARAGVDLFDHITFSLGVFGVPGPDGQQGFQSERGSAFQAITAVALLRVHTAGLLQGFAEGGIGPGHLISLAADDHFENPPLHGRGGISAWLGLGARWFFTQQVAGGVTAAWTNWSNVSRRAFVFGATHEPATSTLHASAVLLFVNVTWANPL